jgi:hypothetical protein
VGHYATVQMTGFYYSGTGTRTITGSLLDNANNIIQNFTYTQTGSSPGTTVPASYQISEPGIYKLQVNTINCSNGSGTATMTVGNCQVIPPPTYYYYNVSKYDCNNSCATVSGSFVARSSTSGLTSASGYYRVGDYSYQITSTASAGSFSVDLDGATSSPTCNDACDIVGEFGCECYNVLGEAVSVSYYTCNTNTLATATFNNGDTIAVYPGTTPTLLSGSGSLIGPFGCIS